jgi:hypothetical protein
MHPRSAAASASETSQGIQPYSLHTTPHIITPPPPLQTRNNTLYSPSSVFSNGPCKTFADWQAAGQDAESKVLEMPSVAEIVAMGKAVLNA